MSDLYLRKFVFSHPEIIGQTLYLSPCKLPFELLCQLNDDGTLSPLGDTERSYDTPDELIREIGEEPTFRGADAAKDLFLKPNRNSSLKSLANRDRKKNPPVSNKRSRFPCRGFKIRLIEGYEPSSANTTFHQDGEVFRALACTGGCKSTARVEWPMCSRCSSAKRAFLNYCQHLRRTGYLCDGFKRDRFEKLIQIRKWQGERSDVSPVTFDEDRLFSRECSGRKETDIHLRCRACHRVRTSLVRTMWKEKKRGWKSNEENRILHTKGSFLSRSDRQKKPMIIQRQRVSRMKKLRARIARGPNIRNIVAVVNQVVDQYGRPECMWIDENDVECQFEGDGCALLSHLTEIHLRPQIAANELVKECDDQKYICRWKNCTRKARPFVTWKLTCFHFKKSHCGLIKRQKKPVQGKNLVQNVDQSDRNIGLGGYEYHPLPADMGEDEINGNMSDQEMHHLVDTSAHSDAPAVSVSTL